MQKARLARIRIVKNASGQALYSKKKAHEARMQAFEQGLLSFESLKDEDIYEIQHHHLLQCLEKATVSFKKKYGHTKKKKKSISPPKFEHSLTVIKSLEKQF